MSNIVWHAHRVTKRQRAALNHQQPFVIWLTGLSGSGKSSIANALDLHPFQQGYRTYLLDGDNVRHGLNKDLGFDQASRVENIRRVGEVSKLLVDAGLIVITAFISPYRSDRAMVRQMFEMGEFIEVFLDTPIEVCEQRDPKGCTRKRVAAQSRISLESIHPMNGRSLLKSCFIPISKRWNKSSKWCSPT